METTIEIFRVILDVYRKHNFSISTLFQQGPTFHKRVGYRFILGDNQGIKELETPYGRFLLYTCWTDTLLAIKKELLSTLGREITHINGKKIYNE